MTDEIMYELMQLSGQEYVDIYAAKVKKAAGNTVASVRARRAAPLAGTSPGRKSSAKRRIGCRPNRRDNLPVAPH